MGYLRALGQRIVGSDPDGSLDYECEGCGVRFARRQQVCPDCGGYRVVRREWEFDLS
jgi:rRNA maturation endonuclease Nob1